MDEEIIRAVEEAVGSLPGVDRGRVLECVAGAASRGEPAPSLEQLALAAGYDLTRLAPPARETTPEPEAAPELEGAGDDGDDRKRPAARRGRGR